MTTVSGPWRPNVSHDRSDDDPVPGGGRRSAAASLYLRPLGLLDDIGGLPLAGGPLRFDRVEAILRGTAESEAIERAVVPVDALAGWAAGRGVSPAFSAERLEALTRPRAPVCGLAPDRPILMGIVNVTPDSFSDGGDFLDPGRAIEHGLALREAGADILDVGGESTRPGALSVPEDEELRRVVPVVRGLARAGARVSIDTRKAAVMRAALAAGAAMINDVTALAGDPDSLSVAREGGVPVVLMHMRGEPRSMQDAPEYRDVVLDVHDRLAQRIAVCAAAGIAGDRLIVDPGIGFGKTVEHNVDLLCRMTVFHGLGCPIMIGASRKRFIGILSRGESVRDRLGGSIAAAMASLDRGAQILRVHDVAQSFQACRLWLALRSGRS